MICILIKSKRFCELQSPFFGSWYCSFCNLPMVLLYWSGFNSYCITRPGCFIIALRLTRLRSFNKHVYILPAICFCSRFSETAYLGSSKNVDFVIERIGRTIYLPKPCETKQLSQSSWENIFELNERIFFSLTLWSENKERFLNYYLLNKVAISDSLV